MARRFSWCTAVALVVLLFVTTEGLRERGTQVDDQKTAGRGTLRFNSRSLEESTTASLSRSRSQDRSQSRKSNFERNDRTTSSNFERNDRTTSPTDSESTTKRPSPTASDVTEIPARRTTDPNRRNGKRFSPERTRSKDENAIDSKVISRKVSNGRSDGVTERLDNTGPSVFALTTESSRSRTGRKIQTTFSTKDLKTQIPASRRYNKKSENVETTTVSFKRGRPTTERSRSGRSKVNRENSVARKGQEALLYESESVRVDIPLAVDGTESPSSDPTTVGFGIVSQRRSDTKETLRGRSGAERKSRGRSSDSEAAGSSRNGSRRGSSRFNDFSTTEANEVGSRKAASRDRLKETRKSASESRSRSRGREQAKSADVDVKRKSGDRNSLDRRSRLSEGTTRSVESRGQDQDARRSRSRARTETTPLATDVTTTVAPETTVFTDSTSTEPEVSSTTLKPTTTSTTTRSTSRSSSTTERNRGRGRGNQGRKLKEDFFNHGLGFRGRKPSLDASNTGESRRPIPKNDSYINPGWTLRRRPPNLNYSDNLPQTIPSSRDQTNEVIPQNEVSTSTEIVTTVETSTSTARRGSKKLQSTEESTTEMDVTTKSFRRGNKTFEKNRNVAPGKQEHEESDNYPPEFKARLSLLKSTNTKIPAPKTTSRTPLEDQKNTFGRRSRSNSRTIEDLENAASGDLVVKDQNFIEFALINANGLRRVKRSSAALFAERSRMKLELARRLVKPELNIEENDLDATTASSFSKPRPTVASTVDETAKVAKFVKPSAGRRTSTEKRSREDEKSKVSARTGDDSSRFARPNSKKGRIISERMVTSISVEERAAEQTTKPYSSSQSVVTLSSAEEGSATTIDTTRIRLSSARNGKKSKEETSKRREHDDTITTFKPKKPYAYQSRVTKSQEQSTTPEENLVTSKKTYASSKQNGGQRKFQSSREEDARRTKSTTVTKPTFRPRYSKRTKPKSIDDKLTDYEATITTKVPVATSRYSRKKSVVKATEGKSKTTTEGVATQTKKLEFRPRTATYRRHSEVPTTLVESSTKVEGAGVAITPRSTKYSATLKTSTESARSVAQEPQVNLRISNDTAQEAAGITGSSNGDTGSNIFNPTRSTILAGNGTLLEQLRSTVAPLLNSLGNKTPVFSGSYSNVNVNSAPRITPNGSPPRFSARYKGAELFVRKQNNIYQPTVPSITSSSTTPATTVENSGSAPPIDVSSPGEPRFLTLYHALESADIRNELEANTSVQADRVLQVDSNATVANDNSSNSNNDTTSPSVATTGPQTPDTTANTTLTSRLSEDTENTTPAVTTGVPETPATTEQVATTTEQPSNAEQQASSTESPSTEQPSTNAVSMSPPEQSSTDAPTTTVGSSESSQILSTTTTEAPTTTGSSTEANVPSTTEAASTTQGAQGLTESTTMAAVSDAASMSESPESNTIPFSETPATQSTDSSSTDAPTTEAISSNMVDAETTTMIPTTTSRPRLIDLAQDILSRLQASLNVTTQPSVDSTTIPPTTEISNAILDIRFDANNTLQSLSQLNETGTAEPATTDETTTQSAVGSVPTTTPATTTDPSSSMVSTQEANTLDESSPVTTTTPVTPQDSQTVPNTESTTVGDPNSSSSPPLDVDATTASTVTTTNDTLLTELMSIAKTLFSEEMNDTETSVPVQTTTDVSGVSGTIQASESSSISPDVTTETVEATPTTVTMSDVTTLSVDPSQNEVDSTDPTVTVSSTESSTDTPSTTLVNNMLDNLVDVARTNDTATLGTPLAENVESTTPSLTTENEQTTLLINVLSRLESGPDTTTQLSTTTQNTETTVASTAINFELTTNTFDLISTDSTTTTTGPQAAPELTETTTPLTDLTTVTPELSPNTSTNQPEVTTIPETTQSTVNTMSTPLPEMIVEQTTVVSTTESIQSVTTDVTTTSPITSTPRLDVNPMDDAEVTTSQTPLTSSLESIVETTTNTPSETTNLPQTTPNLENETPTVVARFQDTTSATAQGTAGSGIGQTTENTTPMTMTPSTPSPMQSTTQSLVSTTSSSVETTTTTPTMTTTTQTTTKIGRVPELATTQSSMGVVTVTPMPDTTVPTTVTGAVEDNLVSTEAGTTMQPMGPMNATMMTMNATAANTTAETTTPSMQTTPATSTMAPSSQAPTTAYMGRFGGSRLTPAPRFSLSSTTRAPLRDYLVYGIYPNKTIVRKRPEDNLIDARNVDSPYVIFGIFPDGRLVRKFPNGTIIPDPPRSPVEVVFSLSTTTTTNRPPPRPYYNQANQGVYNQYQGPVYSNIRRPEPMRIVQSPGTVDLGLTGNAIVGPNGGGPGFTGPLGTPASLPSTNEMSNALVNTQMGTASVTPTVSTGRPPTVSQGGRIVQDRERDEATRTKEVGGQRSSVYIGQDKFVNYWTDGASTTNPRVLGVKINSVATGSNLGPSPSVPSFANLLNNEPGGQVTAPPGFPWRDPLDQIFGITTSSPIITASVASNSLDDSSESSNPTAARPVNPFVEIFTPLSNAIGMPRGNGVLSVTGAVPSTTMQTTPITTTMAPTPPATPSTSATPPPPPSTPTTTIAPTTTTTPSTTTPQPTTAQTNAASQAPQSTPGSTGPPSTTPTNLPANLLNNMQQQNAFGTSFNDLVFLNSLLQDNSRGSKTKTLTQVEQLLANKILSLALNGPDPGPTRAPKAISFENASPNSVYQSPKSYEPIVIDLSPSSTATSPTWKPTQQTSQKAPISSTTEQVTQTSISTTTAKRDIITSAPSTTDKTTLISTTKVPVSPKTVTRPRTTTEAPVGLAGLLWQTLLGGGLFGPSTTERPLRTKQVKTVTKSVNITPKPIPTTQRPTTTSTTTTTTTTTTTARTTTVNTIDISKIHVSTPNSIGVEKKAATPVPLLSTTKKSLLNNPNPRLSVPTSTFSPEEETRFLLSILRAAQQDEKAGGSKNSLDDEAFLRAILSGQASPTSTPPPQTEISNAALLAALLKAQGIEPETPATNIREQLQLASLGQSVTSAPSLSPASSGSTTITTRPTSTATRATDTTKNTVTPRPTSRPRVRTTTWSPSSTYPPPLFSSFSNYATPGQSAAAGNSDNGAIFGATRAFSQFLGAALSGAAQQLQSLVRNGTRIVSEVVG
ncbi:uncharacterized protein LOC100879044 isoform X3 [Megachile rotundata]|uniref:uncharacterized protein LOC100879044 isoform X3 n=1 Tax=Megachile rotundata TaxID=143995 RepID=UPI003FD19906